MKILQTLKAKWVENLFEVIVLMAVIYGAFAMDNWNEKLKKELETH